MDFTSASLEPPKTGRDKNKDDTTVYVQNCIVVLEFVEKGTRHLEYLDFLCDTPDGNNKNDYHFVLHVWLRLFRCYMLREAFDSIEVWTDGGPHHFKTRYCQFMWHMLSSMYFDGKRITHNFFTSYHGHSLADAHAATDKRLLRTQYDVSQQQRFQPTEASIYWGPCSAADLAALLSAHATNTQAFHLPSIPRDEGLKPDVLPLNAIKSKHCFVYERNTCRAFERTNEGEGQPFSFTVLS